jgi:hypothetical protein
MLHRLITRFATLLLVAGLLAAPAAAGAKRHHKRHARHHLVKKSRAVIKSAGRAEQGGLSSEPTEPSHEAPAPSDDPPSGGEPGSGEPGPVEQPQEPGSTPPPAEQPSDAGVVASYGEGVLNVELMPDGHVVGRVIPGGTQFSCRSASTHETVTEGCNASLLTPGRHVHEFTVNYGPAGAWFQRIIIVLD